MEGFLTSVYAGEDIARPTFFELVAQDQLMDMLRPALDFLVSALAESAPPRLLPLLAHGGSLQNALFVWLEAYHLRYHGASFAEHFFGLRRRLSAGAAAAGGRPTALEVVELARQGAKAPPLSGRNVLLSLIAVTVLPWARAALVARYRVLEATPASLRGASLRTRALALYPWAHMASHLVGLAYRVLYLLGRTGAWSPSLHVLGLRLERHFPEPPPPPGAEPVARTRGERAWEVAAGAGSAALWGAVYALQFGQWWYRREHLLQPYQPKKVPPPPPPRPPYQIGGVAASRVRLRRAPAAGTSSVPRLVLLPQDRSICPLCHRPRRNPACSTAGFVFCYPCLVRHVEQHRCCPITGVEMTLEQVRRVRDDAAA